MQRAFEKIIDELKAESIIVDDEAGNRAVEIINQVASEYGEEVNENDLAIVESLPSLYPLQDFEAEAVRRVVMSRNGGGWIPVSSGKLPEDNKPVLCWVRSTTIASGETFIIGSCSNNKFWFLQTYEIGHHHFPVKDYEVVAWCELPEPYKPKFEFECANPASPELIAEVHDKLRKIEPYKAESEDE